MKTSPLSDGVEITQLLKRHQSGDPDALHQLIPQVYHELRRLAQYHLKARGGITLQPTDLVHEAYLHLFDGQPIEWQNRAHFFHTIGQQMRWLVVDHARQAAAQKRGGQQAKLSLEEISEAGMSSNINVDLLALEEALSRLEVLYPRVGKVVELRYFVGLNEMQTAEVLELSDRQVRRDWAFAKCWLLDQLQSRSTVVLSA
ncbi:MAG: RNA polymerase subunit sigma-70 [Acidobacteria bacterium]|nr:RNA polymerase subunit sigma-70 [Acidobacteriota bacterium]